MAIKEPFTDLEIAKAPSGFYEGYSLPIAVVSKLAMVLLVLWALIWPGNANGVLGSVNGNLLKSFNSFYIYIVALFVVFLIVLAVLPQTGKRLMGREGEKPEFSNFSWFSMMFGAGLGVGLMVFATAEPINLWGSNPETVSGAVAPNSPEAVKSAFRYTFLHYGFTAWSIYVITGLSLAYYAYTRNMPLTIRTALTPLFGKALNGPLGDFVDILGVLATILGVSVTIGFGVSQFVDGVYAVSNMEWLMDKTGEKPSPSTVGLIVALVLIMGMSIISAVSGVGRGVKYLSNLNLVLSLILLLIFVFFGSFLFAMTTYATALVDYIVTFLPVSFTVYGSQSADQFASALPAAAQPMAADLYAGATNAWGSFSGFEKGLTNAAAELPEDVKKAAYAAGEQGRQFGWQAGWSTFYWAWWIAFSPFVGLFLARISRGRSVREFIIGCVILPSLVCFAWMTILGGTSVDLELNGGANGVVIAASDTETLFVTLKQIISGSFYYIVTIMCVVLIMTFLVTSADSGILVMNTIMSGGEQETGNKHRVVWGVILTLVIGSLLIAGKTSGGGADPMEALKSAMIIGALPFTMVMGLMCLGLIKALIRDSQRDKQGSGEAEAAPAE